MNIKILALLQTLGIFASGIITALAINYVANNLDEETIKTILGGVAVGAMVYLVYQLCLTRLQVQESFKSAFRNLDSK